jgi:hypothetical protein
VKLHTNGTLIPMRLGKVSLRHLETMIRRGRPDEITKEPKRIRKRPVRRSVASLVPRSVSLSFFVMEALRNAAMQAARFGKCKPSDRSAL